MQNPPRAWTSCSKIAPFVLSESPGKDQLLLPPDAELHPVYSEL